MGNAKSSGRRRKTIKAAIGTHRARSVIGNATTTMMTNKVSMDDFDLLKVIGRGSYGKVYQIRHRESGEIFALKALRKEVLVKRGQVEHTKSERRILELIEHPFIISLQFAFQTPEKLYMVFDFFNGGELFTHLRRAKRFSEQTAAFYAGEIFLALEFLHSKKILYRDLKPENVLLDHDGHVRLCDFGLAKEGIDLPNGTKTFCGTPEYIAPEVLMSEEYSQPVDWWAFGVFLFEIVVGIPPFYSKNKQAMYRRILLEDPIFPPFVSEAFSDLISGLLTKEPVDRWGPTQIRQSPFFDCIDWNSLIRKETQPPIIPNVSDTISTDLIDQEFTNQAPVETPTESNPIDEVFDSFSYCADSRLDN